MGYLRRRQGPVLKQRDFGSVVAQSREISCPDAHCTNEVWKFLTSSFDGKGRRTFYGQLLSTHILMKIMISVYILQK